MRFGVPGREAREVDHRPARRDPRAGGDRLRLRRRRRPRHDRRGAARSAHDAIVLAIGSRVSRDLGRAGPRAERHPLRDGLPLPAQPLGRRAGGPAVPRDRAGRARSRAAGKRVIVIGGGDTGHGLHLQLPPRGRAQRRDARRLPGAERGAIRAHPWPLPPKRTPTTYALEEGGKRRWGTEVTGFGGEDGHVTHVYARQVTGSLLTRSDAGPGQRVRARGRPRADRDRLRASRARRPGRASWRSSSTAAATSAPSRRTGPRRPACSPAATRGSASRWSSPRSPRDASARASSTRRSAARRWTRTASCSRSAPGAARRTARCAMRPRPPEPAARRGVLQRTRDPRDVITNSARVRRGDGETVDRTACSGVDCRVSAVRSREDVSSRCWSEVY